MEMNFGVETTKVQPLYILYVLKKFTDENNTLSHARNSFPRNPKDRFHLRLPWLWSLSS